MNTRPVLVTRGHWFAGHLNGIFHLENTKRIAAFETVLADPSLAGRCRDVIPRSAATEELAWIHTPAYIDRLSQTAGRPFTSLDFDTQTTADSFEAARLAVGAVFNLIDEVQADRGTRGFAFVRPPGHHAESDQAMGFCLFNNTALGAAYLKERYASARTLIVDIDAHHGNGIQNAFYATDEVLYISFHLFPGFPGTGKLGEVGRGRGEGFTVNVPMGSASGDDAFAQIIAHLVQPLAQTYGPDMILVACGFDLYLHDRMGGMRVTPEGYALLTRLLIDTADTVCEGRILFVLEGGYSMRGIRECGLSVMQTLCGIAPVNIRKLENIRKTKPSRFSTLRKVIEIQRKYWPVLS